MKPSVARQHEGRFRGVGLLAVRVLARVARHDGGMGLQTWIVDQGGRRWVAKSVAPHLNESFAHGLQVARLLGEAGISAGAPVPALSGPLTVDTVSGDRVALLTWVPGSPLIGVGEGSSG
jgi:Phosphotransferase enzyme family